MSQNQIRTRFIAFDLKLLKLSEREDLHTALAIANVEVAKILDIIANDCKLTVMSISFASVPFVVKNDPDTAASLQGIAVFAGGNPDTESICKVVQMLLKHHAVSKYFTKSSVELDEESDVIILELTFSI